MTTHAQSPSGFSYAQAAKGKPTTPASTSNKSDSAQTVTTFTELCPNQTWADDVESSSPEKIMETQTQSEEQGKAASVKDNVVERTKSEVLIPNGISGVSSPDLGASSTTTANTDDSSSAPNGTSASESTWETKSQSSEPAWIVERKERQSTENHSNGTAQVPKSGKKDGKDTTTPQAPPKPVVLHEAPPPAVNPWARRAEGLKKAGSAPGASTPSAANVASPAASKEAQAPREESRMKANSVAEASRESLPHASSTNDVKESLDTTGESVNNAPASNGRKPAQREHQSLPNLAASTSPNDNLSWPTPEIAHDKERSDSHTERESGEENDADANASSKLAKKIEWKVFPVTPNVIWSTQDLNRPPRTQGSERGRGNSSSGRGRGRGAPSGAKGGDRTSTRHNSTHGETEKGTSSSARGRTSPADRLGVASSTTKSGHSSGGSKSRERGAGRAPSTARNHSSTKNATHSNDDVLRASAPDFTSEVQRSVSPRKVIPPEPERQDDSKISEATSRSAHVGSQGEPIRHGSDGTLRDGAPPRRVASDGRKDSRSFENYKEWNGASRGSKRGGRGRGGSREFNTGHQANQTFSNSHAEFQPTSSYGTAASPSGFQGSRPSQQQFSFASQGRGGWPRGGLRSQSIPVENIYGGRFPQFVPPGQPLQMPPPYMNFEYGMPVTAFPYHPAMQNQMLAGAVTGQLEYYFSLDNLLKDMFLRKHMDSQGFVFLDVIANFNRIKNLSTDKDLIRAACLRSDLIEIRIGEDGKERIRRREGWDQFILPMDQREVSAQNDGPKTLQRPEQPQLPFWPAETFPLRSPQSAGLPGPHSHRPFDSPSFPPMNGLMPHFAPFTPLAEGPFGEMAPGEETRGRSAKSPLRDPSISSGHGGLMIGSDGKDFEPDMFPDEHINALTVVVKMNQSRESAPSLTSRTFSNGSIDSRTALTESGKTDEGKKATGAQNGELTADGAFRSPEHIKLGSEIAVLWLKNKDLPQDHLPQDATLEPYVQLRLKALEQRTQAATGTCPYDLDVLYQFWSHFLIRNFNGKMYGEFQYFANDDAKERHSDVGLRNLVQFYAKALASSNPIRDLIVRDYVELVRNEPAILQGRASKQLRSAWRNGALNLKNRKKLADIVDDAMKAQLDEAGAS